MCQTVPTVTRGGADNGLRPLAGPWQAPADCLPTARRRVISVLLALPWWWCRVLACWRAADGGGRGVCPLRPPPHSL